MFTEDKGLHDNGTYFDNDTVMTETQATIFWKFYYELLFLFGVFRYLLLSFTFTEGEKWISFDENNDYAMNTILTQLGENQDPSFKLFIHTRDFHPELRIFDNIETLITMKTTPITLSTLTTPTYLSTMHIISILMKISTIMLTTPKM